MITKPKIQKIKIRKLLESYAGGTATTNTPTLIAEDVSRRIFEIANLEGDEEALLIGYRDEAAWSLLTTKRLIWLQDSELHAFSWSEIEGAQQPPAQAALIVKGELRGDQVSDLEVFDSSGRKHLLRLEPGSAYYIAWSAILDFCNYVRQPDPINL